MTDKINKFDSECLRLLNIGAFVPNYQEILILFYVKTTIRKIAKNILHSGITYAHIFFDRTI